MCGIELKNTYTKVVIDPVKTSSRVPLGALWKLSEADVLLGKNKEVENLLGKSFALM